MSTESRFARFVGYRKEHSDHDKVFQAGPRICIGMNMALLETKIFIAMMVQRFHVKIQDGEQLKDRPYELGPTLVMKDGLPLQLTPRASPAH